MKQKLLILGLLVLCVSCSKDSIENDERFTGRWAAFSEMKESGTTSSHQYEFRADGTYEEASLELDSETLEVLGYWHFATGTYASEDNRLTLDRKEFYASENPTEPQDLGELIKMGENISFNFNYEFRTNENLTIYPDCPMYAICAGPIDYEKLEE